MLPRRLAQHSRQLIRPPQARFDERLPGINTTSSAIDSTGPFCTQIFSLACMSAGPIIPRIGLLGPFGTGNLGDAAIQEAVIQNIRRQQPEAKIVGFSANPDDTKRRHGIESYPLNRRTSSPPALGKGFSNFFKLPGKLLTKLLEVSIIFYDELAFIFSSYRLLKKLDTLVISGGGQLDDYWGGPWGHPYSLLRWSLIAKASKTKLIVLCVGVCDLNHALSKFFVKSTLRLADYRSFRDRKTAEIVERLGLGGGNHVLPDLALSLTVNEAVPRKDDIIVVGVSPISAEAWTNDEDPNYKTYLTYMAGMVRWLIGKGFSVVFFSSQVRMDAPVVERLSRNLNLSQQILETKVRYATIDTLADLTSTIQGLDVVIASRLHGILLSHLMEKPVLAISYHHKVDIFMSEMGQSRYCLSINNLNLHQIQTLFSDLIDKRSQVKGHLAQRLNEMRPTLDRQYHAVVGSESILA